MHQTHSQYLNGRGGIEICCGDGQYVYLNSEGQGKEKITDQFINSILNNLYEGDKNTPAQDRALIQEQYSKLREAVKEGVGQLAFKVEYPSPNFDMLRNLQTNVAVFSAFKKHDMMRELAALLKDEKGNLKSQQKFRQDALPLTKDYRETWLNNEYDAAVRGSRMATVWEQVQKTKRIYPNLKYTLSRSAHKREEHLSLVGTVLPIDHPLWSTIFPPNGWGCKCSVAPTDEKPTEVPAGIEVNEMFAFNPGKEGRVFDIEKHPYAQLPKREYQEALKAARGALCKLEQKEFIERRGKKLQEKPIKIASIERPVKFNRDSFRNSLQVSDYFLDRLNVLEHIEDHLQNAFYVSSEENHDPQNKPHITRYHHLKVPGKNVNLILEERKTGEVFFYGVKLTSKE